jgi:EAL domain-containing protein (putative c-di-GMP-specific phosphodiesterase class I)
VGADSNLFHQGAAKESDDPDVIAAACKTAACWRAKGLPSIRMGVNLFPAQFRNGTLLQDVEQALSESGLAPEFLELEITENIALGREEGTLSPLKELRAKGIGISMTSVPATHR